MFSLRLAAKCCLLFLIKSKALKDDQLESLWHRLKGETPPLN